MWRAFAGSPSAATCCHLILPVRFSNARSSQVCVERSLEASPSPYKPGLKVAPARLLTAVVTNTVSPQTTGLEWARPGTLGRHKMPSPLAGFHRSGRCWPSATPEAPDPRNEGQLPDADAGAARARLPGGAVRTIRRSVPATAVPGGTHVLRSRIMRRSVQRSDTTANETLLPVSVKVYRP